MRKKLKLLTLAIACALLYDGCDTPAPTTILYGTVTDIKTGEPIKDVLIEVRIALKTSSIGVGASFIQYDAIRTDSLGKFRAEYPGLTTHKTYDYIIISPISEYNIPNNWYRKYKEMIEKDGILEAFLGTTQKFTFLAIPR